MGPQPLTTDGPDGVIGTADDGPVETVQLPGRDQKLGVGGDDVTVTLNGFTREIVLTRRQDGPAQDHRHNHVQGGRGHAFLHADGADFDIRVMRGDMRTRTSESGFSLVELMTATTISLIVIGTAMATFKDAISMNDTATNLADASQNLRGGTNFLIKDLMSAGRQIPIGGIPIPSGVGANPIPCRAHRERRVTSTTRRRPPSRRSRPGRAWARWSTTSSPT